MGGMAVVITDVIDKGRAVPSLTSETRVLNKTQINALYL